MWVRDSMWAWGRRLGEGVRTGCGGMRTNMGRWREGSASARAPATRPPQASAVHTKKRGCLRGGRGLAVAAIAPPPLPPPPDEGVRGRAPPRGLGRGGGRSCGARAPGAWRAPAREGA
eukprot:1803073-Prymnesium_polylepis.1